MILVKYSKFLSSLFFSAKETKALLSDDVVFSKWVFLDDKSVILLWSKNLHFFEGVNSWLSSKIPVTFGAYFSVKETSVFSFDDVVLSKGGFLDNKNVNVRG